jgi:CTP:molybdopterin cytidylyltransferase MocA
MRVQTLQLCAQATSHAAFLMETANNLVTTEEHLRALSARLRAVVTEAIRQGAATVLAAAQLQIGAAVNVWLVEQGFPPGSTDNNITDLIESFEPATNARLTEGRRGADPAC